MKFLTATFASLALSASAAHADYLTQTCEEAVALSALPAQLRAGSSVYVLTETGFKKTIEGNGPFTCIVERNHPNAIIPQCLDTEGARTIIPAIQHRTLMAMRGETAANISQDFHERAANGEYSAPKSIGVNYMMSHYNYIYIRSMKQIMRIPPHLMHYAPHVTDKDVGAVEGAQQKGLPHIGDPGIHGYFISFVESPASPSDVMNSCKGQIAENPPS
ncbi:MAG: hypothetical protein HWE25_09475 [Alphaproteobacteria bacterium]|nr:hypothetical protein [Alphaproteobacteria bacterium]